MNDQPVGVFRQTGTDTASFFYEPSYSGTPVSLSMPVGEQAREDVAYFYLDNLLPENEDSRRRLARLFGCTPHAFDLLAKIGEDVAGAIVLSPDPDLPHRDSAPLLEANDDLIAYWISLLKVDPSAPPPDNHEPRFSLAGQQAKFSLARAGNMWFLSTAEFPSTHIFKPAYIRHPEADRAEAAMLLLAREVGIPAARAEVMQFLGEDVFVTARWDRFEGTRIHAEDLLQALGDPISDKYGVYDDDVYRLLSPHGLERDYLRQMLFNVAIGNADAHAKNYSFLLAGSDVRLAPLYDTLPIFLWPQYDQKLCISINGKWTLDGVIEADWVAWAGAAGYDPELVVTEMRTIFSVVGERLPEVLSRDGISNEGVRRARAYAQLVKASLPSG